MAQERWTAVDSYISGLFAPHDRVLEDALAASAAAALPDIQVTPSQGKLLMLLARMCGARRILEIGTLGGYSTIWLARALPPGGKVVTIEYEPAHADVARANFARAGLSEAIELHVGAGLDVLPRVQAAGGGAFDLCFIDADKPNNPGYFEWALRLSHPGSVIVVDNVIRAGEVVDAKSRDPRIVGTRRMNELIATHPRVSATTIQTVGSKGYDGFMLAIVNAE